MMNDTKEELSLFRETAVEAFTNRSYGRPIAKMPSSWLYSSLLLFGMIAALAWFLTTSTYSRKESAMGWLAPKDGLVRVSVSQSGLVEQVHVEQGEKIEKGQTLFILSQDKNLVAGGGVSEDSLDKLQQEREELNTQIKIETAGSKADVQAARLQIGQLELERIEIRHQIEQQEDIVLIQKNITDRFLKLENSDVVSFLEMQSQRERYTTQKQALASLRQREISLRREQLRTNNILTKRPLESERVISELNRRLIELSNSERMTVIATCCRGLN